jgi:hypothetical protein
VYETSKQSYAPAYLDRNYTIFSMFPTQEALDFFVAEQYGLRNTIFWWS